MNRIGKKRFEAVKFIKRMCGFGIVPCFVFEQNRIKFIESMVAFAVLNGEVGVAFALMNVSAGSGRKSRGEIFARLKMNRMRNVMSVEIEAFESEGVVNVLTEPCLINRWRMREQDFFEALLLGVIQQRVDEMFVQDIFHFPRQNETAVTCADRRFKASAVFGYGGGQQRKKPIAAIKKQVMKYKSVARVIRKKTLKMKNRAVV